MKNRRVESAFVANQQGIFHEPVCLPCDSFGVVYAFKARYVDVLVR